MTDADRCPVRRFNRQFCDRPDGHAGDHDWHEPPTFGELARLSGVTRYPGEGFSAYQRRVLTELAAE